MGKASIHWKVIKNHACYFVQCPVNASIRIGETMGSHTSNSGVIELRRWAATLSRMITMVPIGCQRNASALRASFCNAGAAVTTSLDRSRLAKGESIVRRVARCVGQIFLTLSLRDHLVAARNPPFFLVASPGMYEMERRSRQNKIEQIGPSSGNRFLL